jgi:hypothetical protein
LRDALEMVFLNLDLQCFLSHFYLARPTPNRYQVCSAIPSMNPTCRTMDSPIEWRPPIVRVSFIANKTRNCYLGPMTVRRSRITWPDAQGDEHTVQVTAQSLYEAVA